jgi:hypothetical protein
MRFQTLQKQNRQQGMALILAIGFLAILSILGAIVLNVSTQDLSGTTTSLPNQRSLYAADRSVEYAMNRDIIMNLAQNGIIDLMNDEVKLANGSGAGVNHKVVIDSTVPGTLLAGTVTDVGPRNLPPHLAAIHGSEFGANLYHVNVKTTAPLAKETHVDASIVRLFKLDDDQIYRTSGGG